jgi:bifunctional DNA-binding transcriptional regulator/antitoxin component of YhaV-PrlF toxin-antitoxin module
MAAHAMRVRLGSRGRLVVPIGLRRQLELEKGTEMAIRSDGRRLILETRSEVLRRLRGRFAHVSDGVSLVDELATDRMKEDRSEAGVGRND